MVGMGWYGWAWGYNNGIKWYQTSPLYSVVDRMEKGFNPLKIARAQSGIAPSPDRGYPRRRGLGGAGRKRSGPRRVLKNAVEVCTLFETKEVDGINLPTPSVSSFLDRRERAQLSPLTFSKALHTPEILKLFPHTASWEP